ncbi:hypothetical protein BpHYR1_021365 [Brachionus plicatilis]|uniref:Uncharacterized protein n=1 Tax=Brachionus plicatilis TaxID=10195 RepID=A0A3M7Q7F8_BRAPC|nr:hypothetical protein BpHYR1_021365 [Brachionus plicatilis]
MCEFGRGLIEVLGGELAVKTNLVACLVELERDLVQLGLALEEIVGANWRQLQARRVQNARVFGQRADHVVNVLLARQTVDAFVERLGDLSRDLYQSLLILCRVRGVEEREPGLVDQSDRLVEHNVRLFEQALMARIELANERSELSVSLAAMPV